MTTLRFNGCAVIAAAVCVTVSVPSAIVSVPTRVVPGALGATSYVTVPFPTEFAPVVTEIQLTLLTPVQAQLEGLAVTETERPAAPATGAVTVAGAIPNAHPGCAAPP